eukprot:2517519-Pyramimonas_sp.AAC.1
MEREDWRTSAVAECEIGKVGGPRQRATPRGARARDVRAESARSAAGTCREPASRAAEAGGAGEAGGAPE